MFYTLSDALCVMTVKILLGWGPKDNTVGRVFSLHLTNLDLNFDTWDGLPCLLDVMAECRAMISPEYYWVEPQNKKKNSLYD